MKRLFDVTVSAVGLAMLTLPMLLVALLIKLTSRGPVYFRQERMGRAGRPFVILKFRTMVQDAPSKGGPITFGADPRITRVGHWLRMTKFDELPQLINVFRGEMSLVGPRPEVRRYVEMFADDYAEILTVRPGITDLASIKYRDEATVLAQAANPEQEYVRRVLPEKIRLAKEYVRRSSLWFDLKLILLTFVALFHTGGDAPPASGSAPATHTSEQ
ncbi:MAG: sugar transferase [Planctomycetaceae bacterium]|nr:sugar transferase [Planctomycetaceae bacterium]